MKRFLFKILAFFCLFPPLYAVIIFLWFQFVPKPHNSNLVLAPKSGMLENRIEDLKHHSNIDILILGSSLAYRSFDPRIFKREGLETFNLGSSSQTHIQTNFLLKEYYNDLNPRLVVYEVNPFLFSLDGVESGIDVISTAKNINFNLLKQVLLINNIKTYNTFILKVWYNLLNIPVERNLKSNSDKYIKGGFVEQNSQFDSIIPKPIIRWKPNLKQVKAFEENLEFLNKHNVPYLLVEVPVYANYSNREKINNFFSDKGELYNFNGRLNLSINEDYFDSKHLNQNGVNKFSPYLLKIIKEIDF